MWCTCSRSLQAVQARVWAQGLTIGVLIVAGALTHKNRQEAAAAGMRRVSARCLTLAHSDVGI